MARPVASTVVVMVGQTEPEPPTHRPASAAPITRTPSAKRSGLGPA
jgi:hypothetical protein